MSENIVEIRVGDLRGCPLNVRAVLFERTIKDNPSALKAWDEEIDSMAKTMKTYKTIVPLIVREAKQPMTYEVVSGERRRQAAIVAGLEKLPCIVRDLTDDETIELIAIEDEHRWEFNYYEKGRLYIWLKDGKDRTVAGDLSAERDSKGHLLGRIRMGNMSFKEIGDMLGRNEQYVKNRYYIAKGLPEELAPYCAEKADDKELDKGRFTIGKAYEIAVASDANGKGFSEKIKIELSKRSIKEGWTRADIRNSIDKYIGAQKIISEVKRDSLAEELKDAYLSTDIRDIPKIMDRETSLDSFKEDKDRLLNKPVGEHPFDVLEGLRKKQENIILEIQERGGVANIIENSNKLNTDQESSTWKVNLNWELTLKEPEEVQSLAEFPEERFESFKEADKWADKHDGYALDKTPMQKADKKYWRLMIKKSTLNEQEKKELYGEELEG